MSEEILKPVDNTERLCIIDEPQMSRVVFGTVASLRDRLQAWCVNWKRSVLGNFAHTLLNILEIEKEPDDFLVKRIRSVMQAFQQHETEIVRQMCQVNVRGKVVAQGTIDDETEAELARFTIEFEGGASAYIPLNNNAADRLTARGLEVFHLETFELDKNIRIPMPIEQAIRFGILDMETVEKIQEFPRVYRTPDWTFWHQLKRFFAHYTRETDAPMIWYDNILQFWVPPVLHPSVRRLLFMSATLSERDLRGAFPDEEIEVIRIKPTPLGRGESGLSDSVRCSYPKDNVRLRQHMGCHWSL